MFYKFDQNNGGGYFVTDENLCHRLFIEADNEHEAIEKAEELGCYWDGVNRGLDCPCCGDRWDFPDKLDSKHYAWEKHSNIEEFAQSLADRYSWTSPDIRIFYKNGTVKEIYAREKERTEK